MTINPVHLVAPRAELTRLETELAQASQNNDQDKLRSLSRRYAALKQLIDQADQLVSLENQLAELTAAAQDSDAELRTMAEQELPSVRQQIQTLEQRVTEALHPTDPMEQRDVLVEIRPAAGGDEAGLFASELFRMYARFAERQGWTTNLLSSTPTGIGGLKEVIFSVRGENVYRWMKYESGVHRVQRVPDTEKSGRVHTSTVTVAVVPEVEESELVIDPKDLKIVASTSGGAGGQSVNTTYSAIRLTHLPTGITVSMQDERSQTQNRIKAMQVLRARLLAKQEEEKRQRDSALRKSQIGSGDRSEKIRTYNFPQDRLTDHRLKLSVHNLAQVMDGQLQPIIDPLHQAERAAKMTPA